MPWWGQGAAGMKHKEYVTCASKKSLIGAQEDWPRIYQAKAGKKITCTTSYKLATTPQQ